MFREYFMNPENTERHYCIKCNIELKPGIALKQTISGIPDFPNDNKPITLHADGPGCIKSCLKCPKCGWSISI